VKKTKTIIQDLFIIKQDIFNDQRGTFMESWNHYKCESHNLNSNFTQDNVSISHKNVIRGLHFQDKPYQQLKLVRVLQGSVLDVVVDLRKSSKTFGKYFTIELSSINNLMLWIPPGCAHGFKSNKNNTIFYYKCTEQYKPGHEKTIKWNDTELNINWGIKNPKISEKDANGISFDHYKNEII